MGWTGINPSKWSTNTEARLTALLRNSVQALASEAGKTIPNGGHVPVKTGNLARSVVVSDKEPNVLLVGPPNQNALAGIATIKPGKNVFIGWQAVYARRVNYGFTGKDSLGRTFNQSGAGFAEATAAKWPAIVQAEAQKLGGR